jgi:cold shock CspA family protein/NAD-dependent dihydropyrimidine dehydrogenase PreA subunit
MRSTVKWFDTEKGYGLLHTTGAERDVLVRQAVVSGSGLATLTAGEEVDYDIVQIRGVRSAQNLRHVAMTHIIAEPCIGAKDTACVDVCPVGCIYGRAHDWEQLYIQPEECIDCGLCVDACPVHAIVPMEEVPDKWKAFIAKNYQHFGLTPP